MRAEIHQITTFASRTFRGNPAFVISIDRGTHDTTLQDVAAQLGEPVLASLRQLGPARAELLFHTPAGIHGGAGHSLLAAAHVQLLCGGRADREATFIFADGSERRIWREGNRITAPWPVMASSEIDIGEILGTALGSRAEKTLQSDFGYVAIYDDPQIVADLQPDLAAIGKLDRGTVIVTAPGTAADIVIRVFAPQLGLPEDPVCGTAHRIIVPYWADRLGRNELHSQQLSARGGDLWCRLEGSRVLIGGESAAFLEGHVHLPD